MTRMTRIRRMCVQIRVVRSQTVSHETRILKNIREIREIRG
jgi:hypothetical protein